MTDITSREEFDTWAGTYDKSVSINQFPFHGYREVLTSIFALAEAQPGMSVLDLGSGTGNLAVRFTKHGCELWCADFSASMLAEARLKLPGAHFCLYDLHDDLPVELDRPFDRIVSAYVFHHFELDEKIRILSTLLPHLIPGGRMVIGDITFQDRAALEKVKAEAGDDWEEEFYWLVDEAMQALTKAGMRARYQQISSYAGIFIL